ncbi:MAG TPA: RDD family protein [Thermoanaerobaculia bacterium]
MLMCRNHPEVVEGIRRCSRCGFTFCRDCLVDIDGHPYCATCKTEQLMNVRSGVDPTRLPLAGFWQRFAAAIIDGILMAIPVWLIVGGLLIFVVATDGAESMADPPIWLNFVQLPLMFLTPIYEGLMYSKKNGQTVGKMALKLRVVRADGSPISSGQAWGRAWIKLVFSCFCIVDYIPFFFTEDKTTLHDMVASTRVVETS